MLFSGGRKNGTDEGRKNSSDYYLHLWIFNVREDGRGRKAGLLGKRKVIVGGRGRKVTRESMLQFIMHN